VVTGANSGIGRATAVHLAQAGHTVYGTVRETARADKLIAAADAVGVGLELVELDVANGASVRDGFAEILSRAGRVDHLVNNAGVGGNGVVEETTPARFLEVTNIDLCGAIRCTQAVLPQMRDRGSGTIVNVTSVAGRFGAIAQAPYVAAKWALEGVSEELALELAPFGIRVAIIEPGVTKSRIFAKNVDTPNESGAYDAHYERLFQFYAAGYNGSTDAVEVAEVIQHAIETDDPQLRYPVSWASNEVIDGRDRMTNDQWLDLGRTETLDDYIASFRDLFGIDLTT
jgi:NAD(P)-dependent dehydrogenase (short-subunit alcohol dehydrogenase family)